MIAKTLFLLCVISVLATFSGVRSEEIVCGIATGYPPYQFTENDQTTGFDADVIRLVFKKLGRPFHFYQTNWTEVMARLRVADITCATGMEIVEERTRFFDFTRPYYNRRNALFIRADNDEISRIEDLVYQIIAGDRDSFVEYYMEKKGIREKIRIMKTETKEESMRLLQEERIRAVIAPRAVGLYLAKNIGLKVKLLEDPDPGSPVALAVRKDKNPDLVRDMDKALGELMAAGEIDRLYQQWFSEAIVKQETH